MRKSFPAWATRTQIVGILNVTPDSFSDAGRYFDPISARAQALALARAGADALDFGAESTRPGAKAVSSEEQWNRLAPVLDGLKHLLASHHLFPAFSIDTRHQEVAEKAFRCGIDMVNDVSAGRQDPQMLEWVAKHEVLYVLMHMRGEPHTMQSLTDYGANFMDTLLGEIDERIYEVLSHGVKREQLLLDPGIGFAKTCEQNWEILARLNELKQFGLPLFIGPSRKSFLRFASEGLTHTDESLDRKTLVALTCGILKGAQLVRIHEIKHLIQGIRLADRLAGYGV